MECSARAIRSHLFGLCALLCVALGTAAPAQAAIEPLTTYGSGVPGDAAGQLSFPNGVAVDGAANVFIADTGNNRVSQFTTNGTFVRAWGFDVIPGMPNGFEVCTAATGCKEGIDGGAAGQFNTPTGITFDGAGNLYIIEEANARVSKFSTAGVFERAWGWGVATGAAAFETCTSSCQAGSFGDGAGQLDGAQAIATDGTSVWVVETANTRVSRFTSAGAFTHAFGFDVIPGMPTDAFEVCTSSCKQGVQGNASGQLNVPQGGAVSGGVLYVADSGRVNEYSAGATPSFSRAWGFGVNGGAGLETCTSSCQGGASGSAAGQIDDVRGIAPDGAGNLYLAAEGSDRVDQFTTAPAFVRGWGWGVDTGGPDFEICTVASTCQQGEPSGSGPGLDQIFGIATDGAGSVFVADGDGHRVLRFGEPPAAGPSGGAPPSNAFSFGKLKRNKDNGTATLTVEVPGPGALSVSGKGLLAQRPAGEARASKAVPSAGTVKLAIRSKGKKKRKLNRTGKVKVKAKITYTPTGGTPNAKPRRIVLKKTL